MIIKKIKNNLFRKIYKFNLESFERKVISLEPDKESIGHVLISYIIEPFFKKNCEHISNSHTHHWESYQIARTFLDIGYSVDVIDYRNKMFTPKKNYTVFLGARTNFQRIANMLNEECIKIVHLDTAHWLFNNTADYNRSLQFQQKRGLTVSGLKLIEPNWAIEHADCATILGNDFTIDTYRYAKKEIYRVPISSCNIYPFPEKKDYEKAKTNYIWFGSSGFVHKGLDLVLDAFSEMPDYHIYVCGPMEQEKRFDLAYSREFNQLSNIHKVGWVDVNSARFLDIVNKCIGVIYPSCSEGGGGSVIQCMHAGLIPVVSYESSVDVGDFGIELKTCTTEEIKSSIKEISSYSIEKLEEMSEGSWNFARKNHTRDTFAEKFHEIIVKIIDNYKIQTQS